MIAINQSGPLPINHLDRQQALQEALSRFTTPEIFNTDQGAQFTADSFTQVLRDCGIKISMDGKGRCIDNVFVERL